MKTKMWARLVLAMVPLVSGCDHFWDKPSGSGGGGGNGSASGIFYVLNHKTPEVAGFSLAPGSTKMTAVTNSPYSLAARPTSLAISPNGGFLYVGTDAGIYAYSIDGATGALTLLNSNTVISSDPASTMAVDASASWLVEAVPGLTQVNAIPLDSTTGLLLKGASEQSVSLPSGSATVAQLTLTRSGAANPYVFAATGTSGIAVIPFTSSTSGNPFGTVKTYSPMNTSGGDTAVAVDTSRQILYAGETVVVSSASNTGGVRMFTIGANSTLTEVSASPFASGGVGTSAVLTTTNYVYVANRSVTASTNGNIKAFAITTTGTTTSLTEVTSGTISAGVTTLGQAEDNTGTYILAVNAGGSPDLNAFTIGTSGALTSYATASTGTDPVQAVAIASMP
jgi:6-phosphogluconolactonase